jgi:diaminohydroxyphosphoribosylaminopyrimidine deaminase/5-amino-6-(5-phosphoribosylamino)uracil reductase
VNIHEKYINRCIQIAKNAIPLAYPNPAVGCCIVHKNSIIGEGYTSAYGGSHAEVNAISSVRNKDLLTECSLYVTLEPCSHFGKTPPCSDLILKHKIPRVIIGIKDPNPKVSGKGIKKLKENGVHVEFNILAKACENHHKIFLTNITKKRPFIILKWAETSDGYIAPEKKNIAKPLWISNEHSRQLSHKLRSEFDCILVGSKTIIDDNPRLNTRDWPGKSPKIVVLNRKNNLDKKLNVFKSGSEVLIIDEKTIDYNKNIAEQTLEYLKSKDIHSVIVEGGAQTLNTFLKENLWDEIKVFKSQKKLVSGTNAPIIQSIKFSEKKIANDRLITYCNN